MDSKKKMVVDSAVCQCEESNETVAHVLGECWDWGALRKKYLGQSIIWNVPAVLSSPKWARKAVTFIKSTHYSNNST